MTGEPNSETPPEGLAGEPGTESVEQSSDVAYGIDERPPTVQSALLGLQHYLTMVGANIAVPLALASAMGNVGSAVAFAEGVANTPVIGAVLTASVLPDATLQIVADTVYVVGGTGMAVGGLVAFVLDNTVDGTRAERGLDEWDQLTEESGAFRSAYERYVKGE